MSVAAKRRQGAEDWTHDRRVVMRDPRGLHARPAALLMGYLRRAAPGTRFGLHLARGCVDFGEASKVTPLALCLHADVRGGEEVVALASGPDAEYVLDAVAEVFAQDLAGEMHLASWQTISRALGSKEAHALMREMWEAVR